MNVALRMFSAVVLTVIWTGVASADEPPFDRTEDVIYGRKFGMALTMDVLKPKENPNGAAVVAAISGGWFSAHEFIRPESFNDLTSRGYTVFCVCHGSQPRFSIPECVSDMNRSVRFIRHNAEKYGIDPNRIGIMGLSAGGHLSLMQGTLGDAGNAESQDPVEKVSSRVQAVACFFPPTDFLNYGKEGEIALGNGILKDFAAPFDFVEMDPVSRSFKIVNFEAKRREIGKQISPAYHATSDDPPTLIIHGDADLLVPIQQAQLMVDNLKKAGVTAELITKPGAAHGWATIGEDFKSIADWFDKYLPKK